MKKHIIYLISLFLTVSSSTLAEPEKPDLWFPVGEKLTYQLYWGMIPVGEASVWTEWINKDGRDLISIKVTARSNKFLDKIYPVDDFMESVIDPETFLPLTFFRDVSEGRYRLKEITTFDHENGQAHWQHLLKDRANYFDIDPDTRDLLTFMYYMRSVKLEENQSIEKRVMADEKLYDLVINTSKKETIRLPALGERIEGLKCEPEALFQGLFVRTGKLFVWVSDDDRRIALKVVARVPVANVHMLLKKVEGPGDDIYIRASSEGADKNTSGKRQ